MKLTKNKKAFISVIASVLIGLVVFWGIGMVSAETETYPVNTPINLILTCTINDAIPSSATTMNFTLAYPNGSLMLDAVQAQAKGSGVFNYTITFPEIGTYYPILLCVDGENSNSNPDNKYDISPLGMSQTTSQGIGSGVFLFTMLALTCLFGWIGFKLVESKNLWIMGIFFLFLSILFVTYDVWLGYEYHRNFTGLANSGMPGTIFYVFMTLLVVGFLSSLGLLFLRWKDLAKYIKNQLKKKKEDEEFDKDFE
jgi:hypothetical protein